mmetsp:Transcript_46022/g.96631  ORF Transcript_46022/g.96631 Transcript_46022/m.96631 type:complete len:174 (-) Transcript_46022:217-738(-)
MVNATEALSLILVGALWGCTNPLMRKGFAEETTKQSTAVANEKGSKGTGNGNDDDKRNNHNNPNKSFFVRRKLALLANIKVWLPYLVNQCGSLLYYKTLASSNLTLSVPICNAMAMAFSSVTSVLLGERVDRPGRAAGGVCLVLLGVAICMYSSLEEEERGGTTTTTTTGEEL